MISNALFNITGNPPFRNFEAVKKPGWRNVSETE
jgi:hypothetical protein